MRIAILPFETEHERAAAAFNERMRIARAPSAFLLPERAKAPIRNGSVTVTHYVAVDQDGHVRGGVMCMEHPAVIAGSVERAINIQSPLSEGIVEPAFTLVGPQLVKYVVRRSPYVFVVGMGGAANPLPRLLKAMGWALHEVPFYFRILRASRCVRQIGPLRTTALRRVAGAVAAATGAAAVALSVLHRASSAARQAASRFEAVRVESWSAGADTVWERFHRELGFGVLRNSQTLPFFYPGTPGTPQAWWVTRGGRIEGWFGLLVTRMTANPYFGNLVVATLTDCIGTPEAIRAALVLAIGYARANRADLLITNQQHRLLRESCREAGWRGGPSNFLVATSRALTERYDPPSAYVTRRDGDGLTNLSG
jgi:hypothetical protein